MLNIDTRMFINKLLQCVCVARNQLVAPVFYLVVTLGAERMLSFELFQLLANLIPIDFAHYFADKLQVSASCFALPGCGAFHVPHPEFQWVIPG